MVELVAICGIQGAGKSTYVKNNYSDYVKVCPDEIRVELLLQEEQHKGKIEGQLINELYKQEDRVWGIAKHRAMTALQNGQSVVFDATNLNIKARKQYFKWLKEYNLDVPVVAVFLNVSIEKAIEQDKKRGSEITGYDENNNPIYGRMVSEDFIRDRFKRIVPPSLEEGFSKVIIQGE